MAASCRIAVLYFFEKGFGKICFWQSKKSVYVLSDTNIPIKGSVKGTVLGGKDHKVFTKSTYL